MIEDIMRYDMPRELLDDPLKSALTLEVSEEEGDDEIDSLIHDLDTLNTEDVEGIEVMETICSTSEPQVRK